MTTFVFQADKLTVGEFRDILALLPADAPLLISGPNGESQDVTIGSSLRHVRADSNEKYHKTRCVLITPRYYD